MQGGLAAAESSEGAVMRASLTRGGVMLAVLFGLPVTGAFAAVTAIMCRPDPPGTKTATELNGVVKH